MKTALFIMSLPVLLIGSCVTLFTLWDLYEWLRYRILVRYYMRRF